MHPNQNRRSLSESQDENSPPPSAKDIPPTGPGVDSLLGGTLEVSATSSPSGPAEGFRPESLSEPDFLGMAVSAATSMARFAASGFRRVDQEVHSTRVLQCSDCKFLEGTRCRLCGCLAHIKAWLPHEDCPVGKWPL